jgi:cytochrome oxidase Cu insertion factor (SCO1/SenC/PrrC family)
MNENSIPTAGLAERSVVQFSRFLSSGRFAMFVLWVLFFYEVFVAVMTFAPIPSGAAGAFLEDFRVRCYQFEPKTGMMQWSSVEVMLAEPVPLAGIVGLIWWPQIRVLWRDQRRQIPLLFFSALLLVLLIAGGLAGVSRTQASPPGQPFPAERLRSALPMPAFELADQDERTISSASLKGEVVLVTAIYSTCTAACPMMLKSIRGVLDKLSPDERKELSILAYSLNPDADTQELRSMIAQAYNFDAGKFHFVNGEPKTVNALLDKLGVSRQLDPKTGEIVHSSLFLLLDRQGRIAYRLSNSEREQPWLISAVRTLLAEPAR